MDLEVGNRLTRPETLRGVKLENGCRTSRTERKERSS